jgi:hypothetical protein
LSVWDLSTQPITTQLRLANSDSNSADNSAGFSADARRLAVAMADGNVQVWELPVRGAQPVEVPAKLEKSPRLALNADGSRLAIAQQDRRLELWDVASNPPIRERELLIPDAPMHGMAFSPDGRLLASGFFQKPIQVWDIQNPDAQPALLPNTNSAQVKGFSADGRELLTPGEDGGAQIWDTAAFRASGGPIVRTIVLPGYGVSVAATSAELPDLLATSDNKTTLVWTRTISDPRAMIFEQGTVIGLIAFKPGGQALLGVALNGEIHEWPLDAAELIGPACALAGRSLTWEELRSGFDLKTYRPTCAASAHPSYIDHQLDDADAQAVGGELEAALTAYAAIQRQNPRYIVAARHWHKLCQAGARWGKLKDVLDACEKTVALEPANSIYRGSRGIARALTGNANGAIEDFEAYIATVRLKAIEFYPGRIATRRQWIAELKAGKSFDRANLEALLKKELAEGD